MPTRGTIYIFHFRVRYVHLFTLVSKLYLTISRLIFVCECVNCLGWNKTIIINTYLCIVFFRKLTNVAVNNVGIDDCK